MIYFDNAATSLKKPPGVTQAVAEALSVMGNPGRSGHTAARLAADAVYECRTLASDFFEVEPTNAVFTMNATHGLNIAIRSLVPEGGRVVISGFEHNSVTRVLAALRARVAVAGDRLFDRANSLRSFETMLRPDTDAVIVNHVSNVFGFVQPLEEIAELCYRKKVPLIIDAAQSAGVLPLSVEKLHAAFIAMPGHKALFGPQGSGLLLCGSEPKPLLYGGTGSYSMLQTMPEELPDRIEAGTLNVPGICGLAAGMRFVMQTGLSTIRRREENLLRSFCTGIKPLDQWTVYRGENGTQVGALSLVCRGVDCETAADWFSEHGIAVRGGLHCSPLAHRSAGTDRTGTVRLSFSYLNTEAEVRDALQLLRKNGPLGDAADTDHAS